MMIRQRLLGITVFLFMIGCLPQVPQTYFEDRSGIYFEFPDGWSRLSKKEWRERDMGEDRTLVTIMDRERRAGFSLIRATLDSQARMALGMISDKAENRISVYIDSLHAAGPSRYQEYKLFGKGTTLFVGLRLGEIVFQGRNPGKTLKWYRVLVFASPEREDNITMLVFTVPIGNRYSFIKDFNFIEDTWEWNDR